MIASNADRSRRQSLSNHNNFSLPTVSPIQSLLILSITK